MANVNSGSGEGGDAAGWSDSGLSDQYEDLPGMVIGRVTGVANGLLEFVQKQPLVAAAIIAGLLGALFGVGLARRSRSRREVIQDAVEERVEAVGKGARKVAAKGKRPGRALDYGELVPLAMKLFENPIVRAYVLKLFAERLAKKFK